MDDKQCQGLHYATIYQASIPGIRWSNIDSRQGDGAH